MWLGWMTAALAATPGAMIALGEQKLDAEVLHLESSMDRQQLIAVTDAAVVRLVGEGREIGLDSGGIFAADVSNDGRVALAHAGGVTVHGSNGREILRLGGYRGKVRDLAISPDGNLLAVASSDGVILHRSADGKKFWSRPGETFAVTFNPDASRVIAAIETGNLILRTYGGRVAGGFDQDPAIWYAWTDKALYTRQERGAPQAWDPGSFAPLDTLPVATGVDDASAHPSGEWLFVDGCVAGSDLCIGSSVKVSAFGHDGALWVGVGDRVRRWVEARADAVETVYSVPTGQTVSALGASTTGDWLVASTAGTLTRTAPDGSVVYEARIAECGSPCEASGTGSFEGEDWVATKNGVVSRFDAAGRPAAKPAKGRALAFGRLGNGQWVSLDRKGRVRVGDKPGKGSKTYAIEQATDLAVGEKGFVVLGADQVHPFKADGTPLPSPRLGPGRLPRAITVGPYGLAVAVVDDAGTLHCFSADGRPLFRTPLDVGDEIPRIAWADNGQFIYIGGSPLTVLDAGDGSVRSQLVIAPRGAPSALASNPQGYLGAVLGDEVSQFVRALRVYEPIVEEAPEPAVDAPEGSR